MFVLINTFSSIPGRDLGCVVSCHRSRDTAERAAKALQRAVKRANGQGSYIPTHVAKVGRRFKVGDTVAYDDVVEES